MGGPLAGVRVVDWTMMGVGPFSGAVLGALGADVYKIESPEGDFMAGRITPQINGVSAVYVGCNTSKRSIRLDLRGGDDRETMWRLIERADVMFNNLRYGVADRLGFGYDKVRARNPGIVYLQSTGFGTVGPMRDFTGGDHWCQVFSGWCGIMGNEGGRPEMVRFLGHLDFNTSMYIVSSILTALNARATSGGARIDISMHEAALALQTTRLAEYLFTGHMAGPLGSASQVAAPSQFFQCFDGEYIAVSADTEWQWQRLCGALERTDLADRVEYRTNADRVTHRTKLAEELEAIFRTKPSGWWLIRLRAVFVPCSRFYDFEMTTRDPQVLANESVVPLDPVFSPSSLTGGVAWKFEKTPAAIRRTTYSGTEREEILEELRSTDVPSPVVPQTPVDGPPLNGLRVVDLSRGIAGPYCGALLADGGADVTKVEPPDGDHLRGWGPPFLDGAGVAYLHLNRKKKAVTIDAFTAEGTRSLRELVRGADAVILDAVDTDGQTPPLSPEEIAALAPRAIVCTVSYYGEKGPLASQPGSELTVQAMSDSLGGLGRMGERPLRIGTDQASMTGGVMAYQAIMAGLWAREHGAGGQRVAVSCLGAMLQLRSYFIASLSSAEDWMGLWSNYIEEPNHGTATTDRPVLWLLNARISKPPDEAEIREMFRALGTEVPEGMEVAGVAMSHITPASPNHSRWKPFWAEVFARHPSERLQRVFGEHGGQVLQFMDYVALDEHPQMAAIEPYGEETINGRTVRTVRTPWRISRPPELPAAPLPREEPTAATA